MASPALWAGAVATSLVAAASAWRAHAVAGLLAAGVSAGGIVAATTRWATAAAALVLALAAAFALVSLGATAVGATVGRLLEDEGSGPETPAEGLEADGGRDLRPCRGGRSAHRRRGDRRRTTARRADP